MLGFMRADQKQYPFRTGLDNASQFHQMLYTDVECQSPSNYLLGARNQVNQSLTEVSRPQNSKCPRLMHDQYLNRGNIKHASSIDLEGDNEQPNLALEEKMADLKGVQCGVPLLMSDFYNLRV